MIFGQYQFKPNDDVTRAFALIKHGKHEKATELIKQAGYADPQRDIELIEGFIKHMAQRSTDDTMPVELGGIPTSESETT